MPHLDNTKAKCGDTITNLKALRIEKEKAEAEEKAKAEAE